MRIASPISVYILGAHVVRTWIWDWGLDVHAFLAWFDILFDCTHTKVKFSTCPHAKYTHWK